MRPPSHRDHRHDDGTAIACHEVQTQMWQFLDHECGTCRQGLLRSHLQRCSRCRVAFRLAETLKQRLARACGGEQAPHWLRAYVRDNIRSQCR